MPVSRLARAALCGAAALGAVSVATLARGPARAEGAPTRLPEPSAVTRAAPPGTQQVATFSGGCFWGIQGVFQHVAGVSRVVSGYTGGAEAAATYGLVSTGQTGHAESVQITYDPARVSYGKLLQILFSVGMDPTQLNYQGPDHGTQYRSAIWTADEGQFREAAAYIRQIGDAHAFAAPIVTTVAPAGPFYPAEAYHQDFLEAHPSHPYIRAWDMPKLEALKRLFPESYSATPQLVQARAGT